MVTLPETISGAKYSNASKKDSATLTAGVRVHPESARTNVVFSLGVLGIAICVEGRHQVCETKR